ncbi:hypothetical protein FFU37_04080 [Pseudoalteromonas distincta]|uniref:Lipoprotein n=1 Tax=Pseudoalteromonas distincta TaxID=77608 RepID=A0A4P9IZV8_9GAMM|nr:hypothetical protein FFU37_04080 [Pseudoalteromonas distincta]
MESILRLFCLILIMFVSGCASIYGITGADEGKRVGNSFKYNIIHPGLGVTIIEPYSEKLTPIETIGKSSPSPLNHTIKFGTSENMHTLKIVGKYEKDLYLDDAYYGSIWNGDVLVKNGVLFINGKIAEKIEN